MNTEAQFEEMLEEALTLLKHGKNVDEVVSLYPAAYQSELRELLDIAVGLSEESVAKTSFTRLVGAPNPPRVTGINKTSYSYRLIQSLYSFSNKVAMKIKPQKLVALGSGLLVVVVAVYGISGFVINQLVPATSSGDMSVGRSTGGLALTSATLPAGNRDESAKMVADYAQTTGLAATAPERQMIQNNFSPPIYPTNQASPKDMREFLKTTYQASLESRHVVKDAQRVQTMVRGYGGRLDSVIVDSENARITFALPKTELESFKAELKTIVSEKFFAEYIGQQNLLPQKQVIEGEAASTASSLSQVQKSIANLKREHSELIKNLQASIAREDAYMAALSAEAASTTDPVRLAEIDRLKALDIPWRREINARIANENASYNRQLLSLTQQQEYLVIQAQNLKTQDQNVLDNVEIVEGSVEITHVTIPEIIEHYVPTYWLWIVGVVATLVYIINRRRSKMAVEPIER